MFLLLRIDHKLRLAPAPFQLEGMIGIAFVNIPPQRLNHLADILAVQMGQEKFSRRYFYGGAAFGNVTGVAIGGLEKTLLD